MSGLMAARPSFTAIATSRASPSVGGGPPPGGGSVMLPSPLQAARARASGTRARSLKWRMIGGMKGTYLPSRRAVRVRGHLLSASRRPDLLHVAHRVRRPPRALVDGPRAVVRDEDVERHEAVALVRRPPLDGA